MRYGHHHNEEAGHEHHHHGEAGCGHHHHHHHGPHGGRGRAWHDGGREPEASREGGASAEVICPCTGVTEEDVRRAVADGARTLDEVERSTGAGTRCGRCEQAIEACVRSELARLAS